jgi:hypothetical protein
MNRLLVATLAFVAVVLIPRPADALTISPTKIDVAGDPGQTLVGEIELFNEQSEVKTFYTNFENFEPRGETGAPFFVGGGSGLATWIGAQGSVSIAPGERVSIPYSITIPKEAIAGGYFAAIFFGSQPPESGAGSEVSIGGKVGSLVLLRVNGDVAEGGGLLEFAAGTPAAKLFTSIPVPFSYRFNNTGGDRVIPRGEVVIKNVFGMHADTLNANKNEGSVLPGSVRKFELTWGETPVLAEGQVPSFFDTVKFQATHLRVGLYKATLNISWGETNQVSSATTTIFMFPWQFLVVFVGTLTVLFFILRQYNRFIIARSKR